MFDLSEDHYPTINLNRKLTFGNQVVDDSHSNSELQEFPQMSCELVEAGEDCQLLTDIALIEGDLL